MRRCEPPVPDLESLPARFVIATGNAGKLRELRTLLAPLGIDIVTQAELGIEGAEETGDSFEANALLKARHAADASGLPAIADDSGLCVDALGGRPGVHSARFAGETASDADNVDRLLDELQGIPPDRRCAAFHCCACAVWPGRDDALIATGRWEGRILGARRGDGGFGYDPVFLDVASGRSAAELSANEKNARSHRGQALRSLVQMLAARLRDGLPESCRAGT